MVSIGVLAAVPPVTRDFPQPYGIATATMLWSNQIGSRLQNPDEGRVRPIPIVTGSVDEKSRRAVHSRSDAAFDVREDLPLHLGTSEIVHEPVHVEAYFRSVFQQAPVVQVLLVFEL